MPRFEYLAVDADGRHRSGGVDAANEAAARALLVRKRLLPVQVGAASSPAPSRRQAAGEVTVRGGLKLAPKTLAMFTRQLATLVEASVPVDEALAMIAAQQEQAQARRVISDVQAGVVEGQRIAEAMEQHPSSFSGLYRAAVSGGERAGRLGFVLTRLSDFLARAEALRTKVVTAMIYPAALSAVAIVVVVCLMLFVVPGLVEQFERYDRQLPLLTQMLIGTSWFLTNFWPLLLAGIAGGAWVLSTIMSREPVRARIDAMLLRAPVVGRWVVAVNASRFIRGVSTLVASGMPVLESVREAKESVSNREAAAAVSRVGDWIEEGEAFSRAMLRSGVIPPMACYMAQSGENAGELPSMLDKAADYLDQEFEAFVARALSLLEPAIIVFMGLVVASIVLAIMLPILQLNRLAIG